MQHKALRLFLYSLLIVLAGFRAEAQNLTKSPYSIIGPGEAQFAGTALQSSMGQTGQAIRRQADINVLNPASYSGLKYTVIDAGVTYSQGKLSLGSTSSNIDNLSFTYFNIGLPVSLKRKIGMVFGLSPYTNIGYNVSTHANYTGYDAVTQMIGTGGLTRFYFGGGAQVIKWDSARSGLAFGFNANYIFGQMNTEQTLIVPPEYNMYNIAETRSRIVGDMQFQGGVQYYRDFERGVRKDKYTFAAGATYTLGTKMNAREEYFVRSLGVGQISGLRDTIEYNESHKGTIDLPYSVSTGISLEKKEKWIVAMDINYSNWSSYRSFGRTDSLKNSLGFSVGGSYVPNSTDYKNYFNRIEYRAGARYDNGNLILSGKNIGTYGVSAGLGLPLGKTKSRLNISGEYFVKGTSSNNLIKEEYFRIIIGINFSDRWFQRYKYE